MLTNGSIENEAHHGNGAKLLSVWRASNYEFGGASCLNFGLGLVYSSLVGRRERHVGAVKRSGSLGCSMDLMINSRLYSSSVLISKASTWERKRNSERMGKSVRDSLGNA